MKEPILLSIVVPCYNEEKNIPFVLKHFAGALTGEGGIELILVDNGSGDQTGKIIEQEIAANHYGFARKVTVKKNQGYGFGILSGLRGAHGMCLSWTHADLQTDPADVLRAYQLYTELSKTYPLLLIKGSRKNRKLLERFFSFGMQLLSSLSLGVWLTEVNAQPKLFPRSLYEKMGHPPEDFSLDLYLLVLAKKAGYRIFSIPVYFKKRLHGEAKGGGGSNFKVRWNLVQRTWRYIFRLKSHMARKAGI